jgi:hypothetical protein
MFNPAFMRRNYEMLVYIKINGKITGGDRFIRKKGGIVEQMYQKSIIY